LEFMMKKMLENEGFSWLKLNLQKELIKII
jgi:hypothetical protein